MAVLNHKKLMSMPEWKKLTASARNLISNGIAIFTDINGYGNPTISLLMASSGISSKETFFNARFQLKESGLLTYKKVWGTHLQGKRIVPRARIYYQVTESVLWKKSHVLERKSDNSNVFEVTGTVSTTSRKEDVVSLGVNKDVNTAKAVNQKTYKGSGFESLQHSLSNLKPIIISNKLSSSSAWQEHANRLAEELGIKFSASWFKSFKETYSKGCGNLLDEAYSFVVDYPNPENKEKLFYWKLNQLLKNKEIKKSKKEKDT